MCSNSGSGSGGGGSRGRGGSRRPSLVAKGRARSAARRAGSSTGRRGIGRKTSSR